MRDLFFKTTKARHPSALLRFVYSFLRVRQRVSFFVRPRSRNSAFFRLQILRKMFVWFYTDTFARKHMFRRLIKMRSSSFRTFLNFCTTLESYIPIIAFRLHFVENLRVAFYALNSRLFFKNGFVVTSVFQPLRLGDVMEFFFDRMFLELGKDFLLRGLPTTRISLGITDTIVDVRLFQACFLQHQSFFSYPVTTVAFRLSNSHLFTSALSKAVRYEFFDFSKIVYNYLLGHSFHYLYRSAEFLQFSVFKNFFSNLAKVNNITYLSPHFWHWDTSLDYYYLFSTRNKNLDSGNSFLLPLFYSMTIVTSKPKLLVESEPDVTDSEFFFLDRFLKTTYSLTR